MYIIYSLVSILTVKLSHCVSFYAGLSFNAEELPSDFPLPGPFNDKLYFYYSNTVIDNGDNKFDDSYRHLDSIASGLSVFADPAYDLDRIPSGVTNKHLLGTLDSWCYVLTLFVFYPKFGKDAKYNDTSLFPHLFNRCMNLNHEFTNYKVDMDFVDLLVNTDTKLDDVYLFEKFSRMVPRPCYLDKHRLPKFHDRPNLTDLGLVNDFVSNTNFYLNDFFHRQCVPYSQLNRKTVNSFTSLFHPESNLSMYSGKWSYLYMPKRVEHELSLDALSHSLFLKVVKNCETKNCKEIRGLLASMALKNLSVKFVVGRFDPSATDPDKKFNLSFALTFQVDQFRANSIHHVFEYAIKDVNFDGLYELLLGPNPSASASEEPEEAGGKGPEKPVTLRERYNKYMEGRFSKYRIKRNEQVSKEKEPLLKNKFQFLKMKGLGQHRDVTFSVTLDASVFKRVQPVNSKYYLKLTHMLDTSVYVDNDELRNKFTFVKHEKDVFDSEPDPFVEHAGVASVKLKLLSTPFVDIEHPEMNSSPVIYHGYFVLDESVRTFKQVLLKYTLTLHTRYMNMHKTVTPELKKVDNLRVLRNQVSRDYSMAIVSHPSLFILNKPHELSSVALDSSYLRYLRFLRGVSFARFAGHGSDVRAQGTQDHSKNWSPLLFNDCNNSNVSVKLCQGHRTGLAISTKVVNTYFCNPIIREMGGDVVESSCYLAFSVPVGSQNEYAFVRNVTFSTIFFSCLVSLVMVLRYLDQMVPRPEGRKED